MMFALEPPPLMHFYNFLWRYKQALKLICSYWLAEQANFAGK